MMTVLRMIDGQVQDAEISLGGPVITTHPPRFSATP